MKNNKYITVRITQDQLQKLNSTGIKNISEVIRRCIDKTPLEAIKTT